jgi:hypothetical protein
MLSGATPVFPLDMSTIGSNPTAPTILFPERLARQDLQPLIPNIRADT